MLNLQFLWVTTPELCEWICRRDPNCNYVQYYDDECRKFETCELADAIGRIVYQRDAELLGSGFCEGSDYGHRERS